MKSIRLLASLACLGALGMASTASAALLALEHFDYTAGENISGRDGGSGFSAAWGNPSNWSTSAGSGTIAAGSLEYAGHFASAGNRASLNATTGTIAVPRPLPSVDTTSGTLYFSYLVQKTIDSNRSLNVSFAVGNAERFAFGQLSADTAAPNHTHGDFGVFAHNNMTTTGTFVIHADNPVPFTLNQTHLIVGRIEFGFDGDNDRVTFYVDPTPGVSEASLTPYIQFDAYDVGALSSFRMFAGAAGHSLPASGADYDQFRFGTTFDAVAVPEPSTYAAIFGGLALVLAGLRRRFRR